MHRDKVCTFRGICNSGIVWRKGARKRWLEWKTCIVYTDIHTYIYIYHRRHFTQLLITGKWIWSWKWQGLFYTETPIFANRKANHLHTFCVRAFLLKLKTCSARSAEVIKFQNQNFKEWLFKKSLNDFISHTGSWLLLLFFFFSRTF